MIKDGLWDAFNGYHMGNTAENVARQCQITRDEQDEFAVASQNKAEAAKKAGRSRTRSRPSRSRPARATSWSPMTSTSSDGATLESLTKLRPAFEKDGTVTAGNASGINDGAAAVVLMSLAEAEKRGIKPLARIVSWAHAGVDPSIMGTGPIPASKKALEKAGWTVDDLDLIEANEAFAAQACAVNKGLGWDTSKVNVNGGAIAIGHPIGASGARVLNTLLFEMQRRDAKKGLATLCIGGGMGVAMCVRARLSSRGPASISGPDPRLSGAFKNNVSKDPSQGENLMARVALVTGGTRGIGHAISVALKAAGYSVAANYAGNDEAANKFKAETGIPVFKWYVADYDACVAGVQKVEAELGPIDVLVNNAGITRDNMFHKMTREEWDAVIGTNLNGLFNMTHPVFPGMRGRGFGRIINISSINGQKGQMGQVNYSAAKAGDLGFTKALAQEGAFKGVTVNAVCPGYIGTEMVRAIDPKVLETRIVPQIPVGRLGEPEEIARVVTFLASDDAGFITGSTISANGGQTMI